MNTPAKPNDLAAASRPMPAQEDVASPLNNKDPDAARVDPLVRTLALREQFREEYWARRDPIIADRLLWRAQSLRHTVHLLPGQTILELGAGAGRFTRALRTVTRGENPITSATFLADASVGSSGESDRVRIAQLPGPFAGRRFDCIVAMDLLDDTTSSDLLSIVHDLLTPGGEIVFYESNPWNPVHQFKAAAARLFGKRDPRSLIARPRLYELLSEIGFIRVYAVYNDFVFSPLTRRLIWWLRNLSILLENAPLVSPMAGSILLHGQRPPRKKEIPPVSLAVHGSLHNAVSVVIPCHNEETNVRPLVSSILTHYGEYIHEIVLVNDGSKDRTGEEIDALARQDPRVKPIHRQPPNGVGRAIAEGLRAATGDYVLTMDCDFQHLMPELRDLFEAADRGYDVVIGSRFSRHSVLLNYPFAKIVANRAFHSLARILLRKNFRDVTNNLKLMRRQVVEELCLLQPGFAINAETGLQPYILDYWIQEVPISWINRTPGMGSSSFRLLKVGGGYWRVLLSLWVRQLFKRGPYRGMKRRVPAHVPAK
jgi:dolichol-phosphate mannosyltransferase